MGKIGLIIGREFNIRVRKKTFILTTLLMPLLLVGMVVVPSLIARYGGDSKLKEIVVVDSSGVIAGKLSNSESINYVIASKGYPEVTSSYPKAFGYLVIGSDIIDNPNAVQLYTTENSTIATEKEIEGILSSIVTQSRIDSSGVEGLAELMGSVMARTKISTYTIEMSDSGTVEEKVSSSGAAMGVAYIGSFMIYMFILVYGMMVLQGVVEEKSNRVLEVIVSSVKPFELMMGKILGVASVAILQFIIWIILGGLGIYLANSMMFPATDMVGGAAGGLMPTGIMGLLGTLTDPWFIFRILGGFILFFAGGYLLYASFFAAIGSAVDNVADTQQLQIPVTIPLIVGLTVMLSVMQSPDSSMAFWFSMIPLTSPIIMMARLAYGVPVWELMLSLALLYGSFVGMVYVAAKIYRVGIFMYGKKPTFAEIIRWMRYKN